MTRKRAFLVLTNAWAGRWPLVEGGWGEYSVLAISELFETVLGYISNSLSLFDF